MPDKDRQQKKDAARPQSAARATKITNPIDADRLKSRGAEAGKEGLAQGTGAIAEGKERHRFGEVGAPGGEVAAGGVWTGEQGGKAAKHAADKNLGLQGKPVITGGRYGDTFGADRINGGTTGGGDMTGSKNDQTSTTFRVDAENDPSTIVHAPGRSPAEKSQKEAAQEAYEREYYRNNPPVLPPEEGRPAPHDDAGGTWVPITRSEVEGQKKGIDARRGQAGGGGDPRVDNQTGQGSNASVPIGKDDRPVAERAGGKINMDKVLEINTKINPER